MKHQTKLLFYTEKCNAEEFARRAAEVGFHDWTQKNSESGLVVFQFDHINMEEIDKLMAATGHLNAKKMFKL